MESIKHAHRAPTSMHTGGRHEPHKRHPIACTGTLNLPVCNNQKGNMSELVNLKPLDTNLTYNTAGLWKNYL